MVYDAAFAARQATQQIGAHFVADESGFGGIALALMEFCGAPMECVFQIARIPWSAS